MQVTPRKQARSLQTASAPPICAYTKYSFFAFFLMTSGFYECSVMHHRFSPRVHHFSYRVFFFSLDLDELPSLARRLWFFSLNRFNFFSFKEKDYLPLAETVHQPSTPASPVAPLTPLRDRVVAFFAHHGVDAREARLMLLTLPRVLGYAFNPVSFYFAFHPSGEPLGAIVEVTNTFREIKPYFIGPENLNQKTGVFHLRVPKHFYVSPFSPVGLDFDFKLHTPNENLRIQIDTYEGAGRTLTSTLHGPFRPATNARLTGFLFKYPLLSLAVIGRIHWHAFLLWCKKLPWYAKAAAPAAQRDLYRPHSSIAPPSA